MGKRKLAAEALVVLLIVTTAVAFGNWKSQDTKDRDAKARLVRLKAKAEGRKLNYIWFNQFSFVHGKPQVAKTLTIKSTNIEPLLTREFIRFRDRTHWLTQLTTKLESSKGTIALTYEVPGEPKPIAATSIFGIEAFKVVNPDGSIKYFAVCPQSCAALGVFDSTDSREPKTIDKVYSRRDFVNPEDIDWFFGVDDFATYSHS